jgi:SAM-dependent methyltransferase
MTRDRISETDRSLDERAAAELRQAGFPVVQTQVRLDRGGSPHSMRADVVAWDVDDDGELVPRILVEVKQQARQRRSATTLQQAAGYANVLGTRETFLYDEQGWHAVSPSFDTLTKATVPVVWTSGPPNHWPEKLVEQAVVRALWSHADSFRREGRLSEQAVMRRFLEHAASDASLTPVLASQAGRSAVLRALLRDGLPRFTENGLITTPWALAVAMSRLAAPLSGARILDPFCGFGTCLFALAEEMAAGSLVGIERNPEIAQVARQLALLGGLEDVTIQNADSFNMIPHQLADCIVSHPPFGWKLSAPVELTAGGSTGEGDVAVLERVSHALAPGGRAVLLLPSGILFRGGAAERVRAWLQATVRVVSVISLPSGLFRPATSLPHVLVVLEKSQPTATLVARLGDDWESQLAEDGTFLKEYRRHVNRDVA